jgi:hypothetical protein
VILTIIAGPNIQPGTYSVSIVSSTGVSAAKTFILTILVRPGIAQIWPIVVIIGIVMGVVSIIVFIGMPRGREVRRVPQQPGVPSLPP